MDPKRLLVVDDEPEIRDIFQSAFELQGFAVTCAEDGSSAREQIDTQQFDVILMDLSLPGDNGLDLIYHARNSKNNNSALILVVSGYIDQQTTRQAADLGIVKLVEKPFKIEQVTDIVLKSLNIAS